MTVVPTCVPSISTLTAAPGSAVPAKGGWVTAPALAPGAQTSQASVGDGHDVSIVNGRLAVPAGQALLPGNATAHLIDVAQVQGQVHAQSVHRVGELAERNPNETVAIVRQWLSESAEAT